MEEKKIDDDDVVVVMVITTKTTTKLFSSYTPSIELSACSGKKLVMGMDIGGGSPFGAGRPSLGLGGGRPGAGGLPGVSGVSKVSHCTQTFWPGIE
eukprot:g22803.t1